MEKTQLNVHIAVIVRDEVVVVDKVSPIGGVQIPTWPGQHIPFHCTALGKVLIAYRGDPYLDALIGSHGLPRYNENTITSASSLKVELATVRERGYALDNEEMETGRRCLGVPLRDPNGRVVAGINVAGSSDQITSHALGSLVRELNRTAEAIASSVCLGDQTS